MAEYWNAEVIRSIANDIMVSMQHEEERHAIIIERMKAQLKEVQSHCPHRESDSIVIGRRVCPICHALLATEDESYDRVPENGG